MSATPATKPDLRFDWSDYQVIADQPKVYETIRALLDDHTEDNATCMVREVVEAAAERLLQLTQALQPPAIQQNQLEGIAFPEISQNCTRSHLRLRMGFGRIEVGTALHEGRPCLWFGKDGQGLGFERDRNKAAKPDETLAAITFENLQGLEAIEANIPRIRAMLTAAEPAVVSEMPTLEDDSFTDPAIAACHIALWTRKDGAMTNAVQLLVRPSDVRGDESGAHPGERFVMLTITREEVAAMLRELEQDLADCRRAAGHNA